MKSAITISQDPNCPLESPPIQRTIHPTSVFLLLSFQFHKQREAITKHYIYEHLETEIKKLVGEFGAFSISIIMFTTEPRNLCVIECDRKYFALLRLCLMKDWNVAWKVERVANVLWRVIEDEGPIQKSWNMDLVDMGEDGLV